MYLYKEILAIIIVMLTIDYENIKYVHGDYIIEHAPIYCKGTRGCRDIIKKKLIDKNDYIFARKKDDEWIITLDGISAKVDKVFFKLSFITSISELSDIIDVNGIEKAPEIIYLEDNEKFRDNNDDIIDIEIRGVRDCDKIYFKVKDVAIGFDIANLYTTLIKDATNYKNNIDYKYFICKKTSEKKSSKKELFLTYYGLLHILIISRNNKTNNFFNWIIKILHTVQVETNNYKNKLILAIKDDSDNSDDSDDSDAGHIKNIEVLKKEKEIELLKKENEIKILQKDLEIEKLKNQHHYKKKN